MPTDFYRCCTRTRMWLRRGKGLGEIILILMFRFESERRAQRTALLAGYRRAQRLRVKDSKQRNLSRTYDILWIRVAELFWGPHLGLGIRFRKRGVCQFLAKGYDSGEKGSKSLLYFRNIKGYDKGGLKNWVINSISDLANFNPVLKLLFNNDKRSLFWFISMVFLLENFSMSW